MTIHARRSPSQAKRFRSCPGSLAFCDTLPEHQRNIAGLDAKLGTAVHGLIEHCLKHGKQPEELEGRIIELVGLEEAPSILKPNAKVPGSGRTFFIVDSDMIAGASMMTDYVRGRCAELELNESSLQLETRTNPLPERDDTSGTADVTIDAFPDLLEVVDYKNGWNLVEHKDNDQLLAYLTGKAIESGFIHAGYRITVVQPNAPHPEGRIRFVEATKSDLLKFQKAYRADIRKCEEAEAAFGNMDRKQWEELYLKAGEHCLFCDAAPVCPARFELAIQETEIDFREEPMDLPEPVNIGQVVSILKWAPRIEALIKAANTYAQREMENGFKIPGLKLVRGRSVRTWNPEMSESEIVRSLIEGGWVSDKSKLFSEPKLISGPQAEKLIDRDRRAEFNEVFLFKPEGNLTVALENDPRPGVERDPADDFENELA